LQNLQRIYIFREGLQKGFLEIIGFSFDRYITEPKEFIMFNPMSNVSLGRIWTVGERFNVYEHYLEQFEDYLYAMPFMCTVVYKAPSKYDVDSCPSFLNFTVFNNSISTLLIFREESQEMHFLADGFHVAFATGCLWNGASFVIILE